MMRIDNLKESYIRRVFAFFCGLAAFDVVLLVGAAEYRNLFGVTHGVSDVMWRIIPDVAMIFFYGLTYFKMKSVGFLPRLALWHGVFYVLLGIALCLPWVGYFVAPFTPIGSLYLSAILWLPVGYWVSLGVAVLFVAFNGYLILTGLSRSPRSMG